MSRNNPPKPVKPQGGLFFVENLPYQKKEMDYIEIQTAKPKRRYLEQEKINMMGNNTRFSESEKGEL